MIMLFMTPYKTHPIKFIGINRIFVTFENHSGKILYSEARHSLKIRHRGMLKVCTVCATC